MKGTREVFFFLPQKTAYYFVFTLSFMQSVSYERPFYHRKLSIFNMHYLFQYLWTGFLMKETHFSHAPSDAKSWAFSSELEYTL